MNEPIYRLSDVQLDIIMTALRVAPWGVANPAIVILMAQANTLENVAIRSANLPQPRSPSARAPHDDEPPEPREVDHSQ